jgi:uncharacterized Zn-finger protein
MSEAIKADKTVEVDSVPVYCPNPAMPIWNHHPKVFLDITTTGVAACPYCGTQYRLKAGAVVHSH